MSKGLVLVIDDEPRIQRLLQLILNRAGYEVEVAVTGNAGVLQFIQKRPMAVLLDIGLPDVDGFNVLVRLRQMSDVAVIMVTARGEEETRLKCLEAGADDYVIKPFSARELVERLSAVLQRRTMPEDRG
jgi:DNA-binding response OmpR family regulator